jgi:hypothetical protein
VRLDDNLSIVFENRLTAWLQAQEELRWLSRPDPRDIDDILERANQLVAEPGHLTATIFVDGAHRLAVSGYVAAIATHEFDLGVHLDGHIMEGQFVEAPHEGWSTVHPLRFRPTVREAEQPAIFWGNGTTQAIPLPNYVQTGARYGSETITHSLLLICVSLLRQCYAQAKVARPHQRRLKSSVTTLRYFQKQLAILIDNDYHYHCWDDCAVKQAIDMRVLLGQTSPLYQHGSAQPSNP